MNPQEKSQTIDEILADFAAYLLPDVFKDEFRDQIDVASANIQELEKYQELLSNIQYAWKKVLAYETYFEVFYPPNNVIENFEALNHHIHAYLQDMDTLKNKIEVFFNILKKDFKKSVDSKEEKEVIIESIDALIEKTYKVFDGILKHRHPHVHNGMRFIDGDLLKSENAYKALLLFSNPALGTMFKPEAVARYEKEKLEGFEKAKSRWIKMAVDNNPHVSGYIGAILEIIKPGLYRFLRIKSMRGLISTK